MNNFEILKNIKISYESMRELLNNNDVYIHFKDGQVLAEATESLGNIYKKLYKKIKNENGILLETELNCPHCSSNVAISDLINYTYVCNDCDENFYLNEIENGIAWYLQEQCDKLNKSFNIGISYNQNSKNVLITTEDNSETMNDCNNVSSIKNAIGSYIKNYILGFEYSIQIWETEKDRDSGESFKYLETYNNDSQAIQKAKELFDENNYACVEVIRMQDEKAMFLKDSEEEQYYHDGKTISYVDDYILTKYIENWINKKKLPITNNLLFSEKYNKYTAVDNTTGDCWVEEFKNKDDAINWLLGNEINNELEGNSNEI